MEFRTNIEAIQEDSNVEEQALQASEPGSEKEQYHKEKLAQYQKELQLAREYWENISKQEKEIQLDIQVAEAKETGYILDTLTTSDGREMAELSYSPENHELVAIAVQRLFLSQQNAFSTELKDIFDKWQREKKNADELGVDNYQLRLDNGELQKQLKNATDIIAEKEEEIKRLQEQQKQTQAVEVAPLSAEEQEAKLINDLNGKRIKIINMRPKSDDFNNKMFIATNAITGEEFEDYLLYSKRYEVITLEDAAQLQAEYRAQKQAIAKLSEVPPLPVSEPAITMEESFQTEGEGADSRGNEEVEGNEPLHEMVHATEIDTETAGNESNQKIELPEKSQADEMVLKLFLQHTQLKAEVDAIAAKVEALEQSRGLN